MDLILLVFFLALVGLGVYLIKQYIPMDPVFKTAINVVVIIVVLLYLFRTFGGAIPNVLP